MYTFLSFALLALVSLITNVSGEKNPLKVWPTPVEKGDNSDGAFLNPLKPVVSAALEVDSQADFPYSKQAEYQARKQLFDLTLPRLGLGVPTGHTAVHVECRLGEYLYSTAVQSGNVIPKIDLEKLKDALQESVKQNDTQKKGVKGLGVACGFRRRFPEVEWTLFNFHFIVTIIVKESGGEKPYKYTTHNIINDNVTSVA